MTREDQIAWLAAHDSPAYREAAILALDGWTVEAALAHVEGTCDHAICTGEHR